MISWLSGLIGFVTGAFQQLWDDLIGIIRNVDSWLESRDNNMQAQINALIAGEWHLSDYIANFISGPYTNFVRWAENRTNSIVAYFDGRYNDLVNAENQTRSWTSGLVNSVASLARSLFGDLTKWIISTIFGPLSHDIASALGWIAREGAYVFDLLTHLDRLMALMLHFIFGAWVQLLVKWGPLVFAYGLRHWKTILPVILSVTEDIIDNVL